MKTSTLHVFSAAALLCAGIILFKNLPAGSEQKPSRATPTGQSLTAARKATAALPVESADHAGDSVKPSTANDETANLAEWNTRFEALLEEKGNRDEAVTALLTEIDGVFGHWVQDQITPLADLPPTERYDGLAIIEASVQEGAAAILKQLGLKGLRHVRVAAGALEAVTAEMQYAEAAPDHASRLALLRLDGERLDRMQQAGIVDDETARTRAMVDLDIWYEAGLAKIFTDEETH